MASSAAGALPRFIIDDARTKGYHPRSASQSDTQSRLIVDDLLHRCDTLRTRATSGQLVVRYTHHQMVGHDDWKIDIAIGTAQGDATPHIGGGIREQSPALIQIAIELKSIWTEHGKAQKNRLRDFNAFHSHAHNYDPNVIAGAFLLINASDFFYSPLNERRIRGKLGPFTAHSNSKRSSLQTAQRSLDLFRAIHLRKSSSDVPGLEAMAVMILAHDNLDVLPNGLKSHPALPSKIPTQMITKPPAPQPGDPLHYETFLQRICSQYRSRY